MNESASCFLLCFFPLFENEFALNGKVDHKDRAFRNDLCHKSIYVKRADKQVVKKKGIDQ